MKVLIIGADSVIGHALFNHLSECGIAVNGTSRHRDKLSPNVFYLDLLHIENTLPFDVSEYSAVVLCAGITSIAACEKAPVASRSVNVTAIARLSARFFTTDTHFVYLSSDLAALQSKTSSKNVSESTDLIEYARQKIDAENMLLCSHKTISVLRLSKVINDSFSLFTDWCNKLERNHSIYPYENKLFSPVSVNWTCDLIRRIIQRRENMMVTAAASRPISYAEAAYYICNRLSLDRKLVKPVVISHKSSDTMEKVKLQNLDPLEMLGVHPPKPFEALDYFLTRRDGPKE